MFLKHSSFAVICSMYSASAQLVYVKEKPSFYLGQRLALDINLGVQLAAQPQRGPREIDLEPKRYGGNLAGILSMLIQRLLLILHCGMPLVFMAK